MKRQVTLNYATGSIVIEEREIEPDWVHISIYNSVGTEIRGFRVRRKELLDMIVKMWPEEVAYQFKVDEDG